jgi:hypothetical protein
MPRRNGGTGSWDTCAVHDRVLCAGSILLSLLSAADSLVVDHSVAGTGGGFLMFGNFSQHMFVDPDDPTSNYNLSYIIVNCPHSKLNYNDGYHLLHHINSKMHWSELPLHFLNHIEKFAQNDAMIFTDIDTKQILKLVFREHYRYDELYRYYVQIRPDPQHHRSLKEFEAIMRHRLKPIPTTVD